MLDTYFVIANSSGNIIRMTRRDARPDDSATITHVQASSGLVERYQRLLDGGQDLIGVDHLLQSDCGTMYGSERSGALAGRIVRSSLE